MSQAKTIKNLYRNLKRNYIATARNKINLVMCHWSFTKKTIMNKIQAAKDTLQKRQPNKEDNI